SGTVSQVRMNSTVVQNVVTYDTLVEFTSPDLKLFPGMTAYVTIPVAAANNVIKIPNGALRYKPDLQPNELRALYQKYGIPGEGGGQRASGAGDGQRGQGSGNRGATQANAGNAGNTGASSAAGGAPGQGGPSGRRGMRMGGGGDEAGGAAQSGDIQAPKYDTAI